MKNLLKFIKITIIKIATFNSIYNTQNIDLLRVCTPLLILRWAKRGALLQKHTWNSKILISILSHRTYY